MPQLKHKIHRAIARFLDCFARNDTAQLLAEFGITPERLAELNETVYECITADKTELGLFPIAQINHHSPSNRACLSISPLTRLNGMYRVECGLWLRGEPVEAVLVADYDTTAPVCKLDVRYISV
ncbi:hypothetical protein [Kingella oralis]|jgi:hypothetical protein|uniref:hypothetical protein n=1 Tax=Kingella oralis TaxID=505 RepID=UPI0034E59187